MKKYYFILIIISFVFFIGCSTPHVHNYIGGICECGYEDVNYIPPHEHEYKEGKCECGEEDPNYEPPHEHEYKEGKCECGETDPNYKKHEHIFDFGGFCVYCGEMYVHEHEYTNGICNCGLKEGKKIPEVKNMLPDFKDDDIVKCDYLKNKEIEYVEMQRNSSEARSYVFKKDNDFIDYLINFLDIEYVNYDLLSKCNLDYYDDIACVGSDEEYMFTIVYTDCTVINFIIYSNGNVYLYSSSSLDINLVSLSLINFYEIKKISNEKFVWES